MKTDLTKIKEYIKKLLLLVFNPRFLLCFGAAWMITNGWSYICLLLGTFLKIEWLTATAAAYLALMWMPFTPEKIITVTLSVFLLKWWFPNDEKTLGVLKDMHLKVNNKRKQRKNKK